jgi:hypothetical protein
MTLVSDARSMLAFHEGPLALRDLHSKVVIAGPSPAITTGAVAGQEFDGADPI